MIVADPVATTVCYLSIGALGTGFLEASLRRGLDGPVDFIGADAGSTDGGPNALAGGRWTTRERAYRHELGLLLPAAKERGIPLLIGSCGLSGSDDNVDYVAELVDEIAIERGLSLKVAKIYSELDPEVVVRYLEAGRVKPLDPAPPYDADVARRSIRIVGVLGAELYQTAVAAGADVVLAGRSTDTAIFAAIPLMRGIDPGLAWHAGKIAECGSSAAEPRTRLDILRVEVSNDGIEVEPLRDEIRCTPFSVSSVQLHEVSDPFTMLEPGVIIDLTNARYEAITDRRVRVTGGTATPSEYTIKLEGVEQAGHRRAFMFSVNDPTILDDLDGWQHSVDGDIAGRIAEILGPTAEGAWSLDVRIFGRDGTMGKHEPVKQFEGHEAFVLVECLADTVEQVKVVADVADYAFMHAKSRHWQGGTTMAYPFTTANFSLGPAYRFNVHHVITGVEPTDLARIEYVQLGEAEAAAAIAIAVAVD